MAGLSDAIGTAQGLWDEQAARPADGSDANVAGSCLLLEPRDALMLSDMLAWAAREGLVLVPRGGGTKLTRAPRSEGCRVDVVLSTTRLTGSIEHSPGDLVATIPAGWSCAAANDILGRHAQRLPIDPPFAQRATIGGLVATDDSGPRRHRYGSPRDLILGIEMALADGRLAKAGGRVVKNVAGYDLSRLLCGSWGALAVIARATFKLSPVPAASCTLVTVAADLKALARLALALADAPLTPSTLELQAPPGRLLVRFESTEAAARYQAEAARAVCTRHGLASDLVHGVAELSLWEDFERGFWSADGTILKATVLPTEVPALLQCLESAADGVDGLRLAGRIADGILVARFSGNFDAAVRTIEHVRSQATRCGGRAVMLACDAALTSQIDPWGARGSAQPIAQAVKRQFDPTGTLSSAWAGAWL